MRFILSVILIYGVFVVERAREDFVIDILVSIAGFAVLVRIIFYKIKEVFVTLPANEAQKLVKRTVKDAIYKVAFLPLVVPPTLYQARLWSVWLTMVIILKLNASSSTHMYSNVLVILFAYAYWKCILMISEPSPLFLLVMFEPMSIALETLHAVLATRFHLLDLRLTLSPPSPGFLRERRHAIFGVVGLFLDTMALLMSLGHYECIWQLRGMTFHLFDVMLFLPTLSLLIAFVKRTINESRIGGNPSWDSL